jgi:hypothetical protein
MALLRYKATWRTWDEPGRQVAVAHWVERDVCVAFPLAWAQRHGQPAMIGRAKERIVEFEGKTGRTVAPGSVLLAFSRHEPQRLEHRLDPDVPRNLLTMGEH